MFLRISFLLLCAAGASEGQSEACHGAQGGGAQQTSSSAGVLLMQTKPGHVSKASLGDANASSSSDMARVLEEIRALKEQMADFMSSLETQVSTCCEKPCTTTETTTTETTTTATRATTVTSTTTEATTTTTTQMFEPMLCAAFGDPHFITFDGAQTTFVGDMIQWLVKSRRIWLQALSRGSEGKFLGFAAGGPFMKGHKLVVYNASDGGPLRVLFDGKPILQEQSSEYFEEGILEAYRRQEWDGKIFNDRILDLRTRMKFGIDGGEFSERFLSLPDSGVYMFKLPDRVEVTLSGVDFMSAVMSMAAQAGGQGGYCGNFNGDPDDDAEPVVPSWDRPIGKDLNPVPEGMVIFPKDLAISLLGEEASAGRGQQRRKLKECSPQLIERAEAACGNLSAAFHKFCIFDVCLSGDVAAAEDIRAAEVMEEKVNARGLPIFMGHGQCLDSRGRHYRSFDTKLRTDAGCSQLLRALALVEGVVGAQLRRGDGCQVLVEPGADPRGTAIPGGWGNPPGPTAEEAAELAALPAAPTEAPPVEVALAPNGAGPVAETTADAAWNCWQLD